MAVKAETAAGERPKVEEENKKTGPHPIAKAYLLLYNSLLTAGWSIILYLTVCYCIDHAPSWRLDGIPTSVPGLYDDLRLPLRLFQTAACLEIVHVAVGIVRSALFTTFIQVFSRVFMLWGIVEGVAGTANSPGLLLVAIAWSITEVIRYSFYFFALINAIPYPIKWLRYTTFYLLYPTGVTGELMLSFAALPVLKASQQWSVSLPNACNMSFNFHYLVIFFMALYIPLFPQLYGHMISQRKKVIGGGGKSKQE